jgi:hypothetical protein
MKHSSITKYNKFLIGGILLYVIPILFISLIVINSIDFDEPKGPYDPNKGIIEPVMSDSIPVEIKKPIKKKTKILTTQTLEQKKVEVVSTTPTLSNVIQKDSLPN